MSNKAPQGIIINQSINVGKHCSKTKFLNKCTEIKRMGNRYAETNPIRPLRLPVRNYRVGRSRGQKSKGICPQSGAFSSIYSGVPLNICCGCHYVKKVGSTEFLTRNMYYFCSKKKFLRKYFFFCFFFQSLLRSSIIASQESKILFSICPKNVNSLVENSPENPLCPLSLLRDSGHFLYHVI